MGEGLREAVEMIPKGLVEGLPSERERLQAAVRSDAGASVAVRYLELEGFSGHLGKRIALPGPWVNKIAARVGESLRNAAELVASGLPESELALFYPQSVEEAVGGLEAHHGLAKTVADFLPDLHEPQLTIALANALHARGEPVRWERIRTFLGALGVGQNLLDSLDRYRDAPARIAVLAESFTDDGRRMDLRISWPSREEPNSRNGWEDGVVIEAKFEAGLQEGQLADYQAWAGDHLSPHCRDLIFLTPAGIAPPAPEKRGQESNDRKKQQEWRPVSWLRLMQCWEAHLEDTSVDLGLVKQLIWRKVG